MKEKCQKRTDQGQVIGKGINADLWRTGKPAMQDHVWPLCLGLSELLHPWSRETKFLQRKNSENLRISQVVF